MNSPATATRRDVFQALGQGTLALSLTAALISRANAGVAPTSARQGALSHLGRTLAALPRRRGFQTVPFMLDDKALWDHEAADALTTYSAPERQMWEVTDLAGPWIGLMREAVNGQVFALGHKDFLAVAAIHGGAHLALFNQAAWDKYKFAAKTDGKLTSNTLITERPGVSPSDDIQNLNGYYGPNNNNIVTLQRRGMVFVACHDSIHAISRGLHAVPEFSGVSADEIAADLTNSLVPGAVLVPSVVAFIAELQRAGYSYAKAG
jgi:intracellular sulfur oxidation DsrE/DsrF family protein